MKFAIVVLIMLCILPYALAWVSAFFRRQQLGKIDNKNPRQQYTELTGPGARAVAAQQNAWEALTIYAAALLAVVAAGAQVELLGAVAATVLIARVLHPIFYLLDLDICRSASFVGGVLPCFYLFFKAFTAL